MPGRKEKMVYLPRKQREASLAGCRRRQGKQKLKNPIGERNAQNHSHQTELGSLYLPEYQREYRIWGFFLFPLEFNFAKSNTNNNTNKQKSPNPQATVVLLLTTNMACLWNHEIHHTGLDWFVFVLFLACLFSTHAHWTVTLKHPNSLSLTAHKKVASSKWLPSPPSSCFLELRQD